MKNKLIYFIAPVSGPINGAKHITSKIIEEWKGNYIIKLIDTAQEFKSTNYGKISMSKIIDAMKMLIFILFKIPVKSICYLNFTPHGFAFYRDSIFLIILRLKNCNVTIHIHANGLQNKPKWLLKFIINKTKLIAITKIQFHEISKKLSNVFYLENSLPDSEFTKLIKKQINFNLLYFSNISEEKGIFDVINLYLKVKINIPDLKLSVYGNFLDTETKEKFYSITKNEDHIKYFGVIKNEKEKFEMFQKSDIMVFLSKANYESSPLILIESLMYSLPIICTPIQVSDSILSNGNGLLYDNNENKIVDLLTNWYNTENTISTLSTKSRNLYDDKYNFDTYLKKLEEIIFN